MNRFVKIGLFAVAAIFVLYNLPTIGAIFGMRSTETVGRTGSNDGEDRGYEMVTLLPKNAIPAINNPQFVTGAEADEHYVPEELVLGVEIDGDARAYSIPFLSGHEIVNDVVGGEPIAVTW
ncbi:DUF3179 domain-containing protein [Chloroflexi bacterium TSY]|nr:DUF3179 domain-containing protein [Chloroflexi bacterium TSY]